MPLDAVHDLPRSVCDTALDSIDDRRREGARQDELVVLFPDGTFDSKCAGGPVTFHGIEAKEDKLIGEPTAVHADLDTFRRYTDHERWLTDDPPEHYIRLMRSQTGGKVPYEHEKVYGDHALGPFGPAWESHEPGNDYVLVPTDSAGDAWSKIGGTHVTGGYRGRHEVAWADVTPSVSADDGNPSIPTSLEETAMFASTVEDGCGPVRHSLGKMWLGPIPKLYRVDYE